MSYPGGKGGSGVAQRIICQMPPHDLYIEPFLGQSAVWRLKRPAKRQIGSELDAAVVASWQPHLRPGEVVTCENAFDLLAAVIDKSAVVYCDPPYLPETRTKRKIYAHEMSAADHQALLIRLRELRCNVLLSGYPSNLYGEFLHDWRCLEYEAMTRGGRRRECLWCNFPEPTALHDYRFLGDGFRERERIRRKASRWAARLQAMPALERLTILSVAASVIAGRADDDLDFETDGSEAAHVSEQ